MDRRRSTGVHSGATDRQTVPMWPATEKWSVEVFVYKQTVRGGEERRAERSERGGTWRKGQSDGNWPQVTGISARSSVLKPKSPRTRLRHV